MKTATGASASCRPLSFPKGGDQGTDARNRQPDQPEQQIKPQRDENHVTDHGDEFFRRAAVCDDGPEVDEAGGGETAQEDEQLAAEVFSRDDDVFHGRNQNVR